MRVFLLINGGRKPLSLARVKYFRDLLLQHGTEHRVEVSLSLDEARHYVDVAVEQGFDTLWMGGGDGTINVLLNHALGRGLTFGVIPMGTVNALARSLGIPLRPEDAVRHLLQATPSDMDVGLVNGTHRFLCFASIGFDAAVVHDVTGGWKRYCGRVAYFLAGLRAMLRMDRIVPFEVELGQQAIALPRHAAPACDVQLNPRPSREAAAAVPGMKQSGYSLMVSNICNYAGFPLFYRVAPCSGNMEFWLFRKRRLDNMLGWAAASGIQSAALQRRFARTVGHYLVLDFAVRSEKRMFLQLDGEAVSLGENREFRFECLPGAARVLL